MRVTVILVEICSGGFYASRIPATTNPQLATGPQKWVVLGPTGELMKAKSLSDMLYLMLSL